MLFLTYEFIFFAVLFYLTFYLAPHPSLRVGAIVVASVAFQFMFGGWISIIPVFVLAIVTFVAGRSGDRRLITAAITLCVASLIFYKYTLFVTSSIIGAVAPSVGMDLQQLAKIAVPAVIPLGISFFTFEFVHYLVDLRRGAQPIARLRDFLAFALFWPTMVAGPVKRFQQFIPALYDGLSRANLSDAMAGALRITIGFMKKWAADNLTGWIEFMEPQFAVQSVGHRWLFLIALALRILLDFSGYSDMAIGFARMMGIVVPENFNWPYLARSPMEFWQRWHISLSSWIRDYVYIPLGGNRLGLSRRAFNAIAAMLICGLWHGPEWNFAVWGLYHGVGLSVAALLQAQFSFAPVPTPLSASSTNRPRQFPHSLFTLTASRLLRLIGDIVCWVATMLFVGFGWLLFFYPLSKAITMASLLFRW